MTYARLSVSNKFGTELSIVYKYVAVGLPGHWMWYTRGKVDGGKIFYDLRSVEAYFRNKGYKTKRILA
jgi:hypothetical protein